MFLLRQMVSLLRPGMKLNELDMTSTVVKRYQKPEESTILALPMFIMTQKEHEQNYSG